MVSVLAVPEMTAAQTSKPSNRSQPSGHTIWWLKKDFRLADNPALLDALSTQPPVTPIFILEPSALKSPETSAFHVAAWLDGFRELRTALRQVGGEACLLRGEVIDVFDRLTRTIKIERVVSHEEVGSERTFARDRRFAEWCRNHGVRWDEFRQTGVFRGLRDRDDRAARWRHWMADGPLPGPTDWQLAKISVPKEVIQMRDAACRRPSLKAFGFSLPSDSRRLRQRVAENEAQRTLKEFLGKRGVAYSGGISSPNSAFRSGSRLSTHLAWGTITGRQVCAALDARMRELKESDDPLAGRWRRSLNAFRARMNWRDHFIQRLETEPTMEFHPLNRAYEQLPVTRDRKLIDAWCEGRTGFPLVDACIRCAQTTGFLNFRMRCMITSVACHAMRLDWRDIMWPMAQCWADYEPGIHIAQLQMQAGVVGINTLRTYNPAKQIQDHDNEAKFIKRWLPELQNFDSADIISHQDEPLQSYPPPIVDWRQATSEMRADYYAIRRKSETKQLAAEVLARHGSRKPPSSRRRRSRSRVRATEAPK